jgi:hypothetical protein
LYRDLELSPAMANFFNQEKVIEDLYVKSVRPKTPKSGLSIEEDASKVIIYYRLLTY